MATKPPTREDSTKGMKKSQLALKRFFHSEIAEKNAVITCTTCPPPTILNPAHQGGIGEFLCEAFLLDVVHPHGPILTSVNWLFCGVNSSADLQRFWENQASAREVLAEPPLWPLCENASGQVGNLAADSSIWYGMGICMYNHVYASNFEDLQQL